MPINFNYDLTAKPGTAGAKATMESADVVSRHNEDATYTPFGRAVFRGADDRGAVKTPAADAFVGVTLLDAMAYTNYDLTEEGFASKTMMAVMRRGVIWVEVAGAVNDGAPAYVTPAGVFTATAGSNILLPGAFFETSTTGAGLAQLRLK